MKKLNILIALILVMLMCMGLFACEYVDYEDDTDTDSGGTEIKPDEDNEEMLYLESDKASLHIGDKVTIKAFYIPLENTDLIFTLKENNGVCFVSENGEVTAEMLGKAVINVNYGSKTVQFNVNVDSDNIVPTVEFAHISEPQVKLMANDKLNLEWYVVYNGRRFTDGNVVYKLDKPDMGKVEDDIFTPAHDQAGEVTITITVNWRNMHNLSLTRNIKVVITK